MAVTFAIQHFGLHADDHWLAAVFATYDFCFFKVAVKFFFLVIVTCDIIYAGIDISFGSVQRNVRFFFAR